MPKAAPKIRSPQPDRPAKGDAIEVSAVFPVAPQALYKAWLSSKEHSAFTGGDAVVDPRKGGKFMAWDGYISGVTLELAPGRRIVQAWRATDFPKGAKDSLLEVLFEKAAGGTKVTLRHTQIPAGRGESYKQGWKEFYFTPMRKHYAGGARA